MSPLPPQRVLRSVSSISTSRSHCTPGTTRVLTVGLLALPFLDRSRGARPRRRRFWIALGAIMLVAWVGLTIYGAVTVPA